jgi:hypothetical protein
MRGASSVLCKREDYAKCLRLYFGSSKEEMGANIGITTDLNCAFRTRILSGTLTRGKLDSARLACNFCDVCYI